jgi:hypothetical protein
MMIHATLVLRPPHPAQRTHKTLSIIQAAVVMVSGCQRENIIISDWKCTAESLTVALLFTSQSAMQEVCWFGEHLRSLDSPLHNILELKDVFEGSVLHLLSPRTIPQVMRHTLKSPRVITPSKTSKNCEIARAVAQNSPARREPSPGELPMPVRPDNDIPKSKSNIICLNSTEPLVETRTKTWYDVSVQSAEIVSGIRIINMSVQQSERILLRQADRQTKLYNDAKLTLIRTPLIPIFPVNITSEKQYAPEHSQLRMVQQTMGISRALISIERPRRDLRVQKLLAADFSAKIDSVYHRAPLEVVRGPQTVIPSYNTDPRDAPDFSLVKATTEKVFLPEEKKLSDEYDQARRAKNEQNAGKERRKLREQVESKESSTGSLTRDLETSSLFIVRKKATDLWDN